MAESGKQLAHIISRTVRAADLLIAHDEYLKVLIALIAAIFKKRHSIFSLLECSFLTAKDKHK